MKTAIVMMITLYKPQNQTTITTQTMMKTKMMMMIKTNRPMMNKIRKMILRMNHQLRLQMYQQNWLATWGHTGRLTHLEDETELHTG